MELNIIVRLVQDTSSGLEQVGVKTLSLKEFEVLKMDDTTMSINNIIVEHKQGINYPAIWTILEGTDNSYDNDVECIIVKRIDASGNKIGNYTLHRNFTIR